MTKELEIGSNLVINLDDKWFITSDKYQYILSKKSVSKKTGKEGYTIIGYYPSTEYLLRALTEKRLKEADIKTLEEMLLELKSIHNYIKKYCGEIHV